MSLDRDIVLKRIEELQGMLQNLRRHGSISVEDLSADVDLQWILERGLERLSQAVFDIAAPLKALRFLFPRLWPEAEADYEE